MSVRSEDKIPDRTVRIPRREHVRRTWYNLDRDYTRAGSRPTIGRVNTEANRAHPPEDMVYFSRRLLSLHQ